MRHTSSVFRDEKFELGIYHDYNDVANEIKLKHLYGKLAMLQDALIIKNITGCTVLDVGAGYGFLAKRLKETGFTVVTIDPNPRARKIAKKWYNIDIIPAEIHSAPFKDGSFDTAVLREVVEHINFDKTVVELHRIVRKEIVIFQTNLTLFVQIVRWLIRHKEFKPGLLTYYINTLEKFGFRVQSIKFCDILALPLSGGLLTRQWCPTSNWIENIVIDVDNILCKFFKILGLSRYVCWRFCLRAIRVS